VLCDELVLSNLRLRDGDPVEVEVAPRVEAARLTVTGPAGVSRSLDPAVLRTALLGKVVTAGDQVSLRPSDLAPPVDFARLRGQLTAWLGAGWTSQVLHVTDTEPEGRCSSRWARSPAGRAAPRRRETARPSRSAASPGRSSGPRTLADLPGLEAPGKALQEWLDLGFHHSDLLARLGASPGMGRAAHRAPSGSGKAALVEAVAHEVGARLVQLWGPQLAATEANAAAKQVVDTLARATREAPAVVLLGDVEAVAPRDGAGPLLPVLLTAVRELVAAGRAAVVCTTAHPEQVTPDLRTPGTLDHELALPLPDRRQRCGCSRSRRAASRSRRRRPRRGGRAHARASSPPTCWRWCARPACGPPPASATATPDARAGRPRGGARGRPRDVDGGLDARPVAAHPRRRRRHGRGQGSRSPRRCSGRWTTPTPSPARRRPAARACCCTARPAAARRSSSRRSPARARPTCCR
jgi:hypothetical protein